MIGCFLIAGYLQLCCTDGHRFMVNRKIFLVGFGLYGAIDAPAEYSVNIQVRTRLLDGHFIVILWTCFELTNHHW